MDKTIRVKRRDFMIKIFDFVKDRIFFEMVRA